MALETFDEWVARQGRDLTDDEIRAFWKIRGRYPHLDAFDEDRMDRIAASHGDGEHYDGVRDGR